MEKSPKFEVRPKQGSPSLESVQSPAASRKRGGRNFYSVWLRRFTLSLALFGAGERTATVAHQIAGRARFEQAKDKALQMLENEEEEGEDFKQLYEKAVSVFGKKYVDELPGMGLATGQAHEEIKSEISSVENESKPRISPLGKSIFSLEPESDWENRFKEIREEKGRVLKDIELDYSESDKQILIEDRGIIPKLPAEKYEEWAKRLDALSVETIPTEKFVALIEPFFPKGWITEAVSKITQDSKKLSSTGASVEKDKRVVLNGIHDKFRVFGDMAHELGHSNDWVRSAKLIPKKRLWLLMEVYKRTQSSDKFHTWYIDDIVREARDLQKKYPDHAEGVESRPAAEYWGEIMKEYFTNGPDNLNRKDVELIEWMIQKIDPTFLSRRSAGTVFEGSYAQYFVDKKKGKGVTNLEQKNILDARTLGWYELYQFDRIQRNKVRYAED